MPDAPELVRLLAVLVVIAALIGLSPNPCGHEECMALHKQGVQRDHEAERRNHHANWHAKDPDPACPYCNVR